MEAKPSSKFSIDHRVLCSRLKIFTEMDAWVKKEISAHQLVADTHYTRIGNTTFFTSAAAQKIYDHFYNGHS